MINESPLSLEEIRQVVAAYFADKPVRRVQVFGSYARGEATADSDLDVLLTRSATGRLTLFDLGHYKDDLEAALGVAVDLGTEVSPFVRPHIAPDLITVYEKEAA